MVGAPAPVVIWCVVVCACTGRAVGGVGDACPEPVADAVAGSADLGRGWLAVL